MNSSKHTKMTLHEAIIKVLQENNHEMTTQEIADEINKRELYIRPKDGNPVEAWQVRLRVRSSHYCKFFTLNGNIVGLAKWSIEHKKPISTGWQNSIGAKPINISPVCDVTILAFLNNFGFAKIGMIQDLFSDGLPSRPELDSCGLYAISIPEGYKPTFISPEIAIMKKNVINAWSIQKLKDKWVYNADIIYYGIAGSKSLRSLRERLGDLIDHGRGKTSKNGPHKGGEIMWQLEDYTQFTVWILPTDNPPEPRNCEVKLLENFREKIGKLPFANRQS